MSLMTSPRKEAIERLSREQKADLDEFNLRLRQLSVHSNVTASKGKNYLKGLLGTDQTSYNLDDSKVSSATAQAYNTLNPNSTNKNFWKKQLFSPSSPSSQQSLSHSHSRIPSCSRLSDQVASLKAPLFNATTAAQAQYMRIDTAPKVVVSQKVNNLNSQSSQLFSPKNPQNTLGDSKNSNNNTQITLEKQGNQRNIQTISIKNNTQPSFNRSSSRNSHGEFSQSSSEVALTAPGNNFAKKNNTHQILPTRDEANAEDTHETQSQVSGVLSANTEKGDYLSKVRFYNNRTALQPAQTPSKMLNNSESNHNNLFTPQLKESNQRINNNNPNTKKDYQNLQTQGMQNTLLQDINKTNEGNGYDQGLEKRQKSRLQIRSIKEFETQSSLLTSSSNRTPLLDTAKFQQQLGQPQEENEKEIRKSKDNDKINNSNVQQDPYQYNEQPNQIDKQSQPYQQSFSSKNNIPSEQNLTTNSFSMLNNNDGSLTSSSRNSGSLYKGGKNQKDFKNIKPTAAVTVGGDYDNWRNFTKKIDYDSEYINRLFEHNTKKKGQVDQQRTNQLNLADNNNLSNYISNLSNKTNGQKDILQNNDLSCFHGGLNKHSNNKAVFERSKNNGNNLHLDQQRQQLSYKDLRDKLASQLDLPSTSDAKLLIGIISDHAEVCPEFVAYLSRTLF